LAYNPASGHLLLASRAASALNVHVLDSANGDPLGSLSVAGIPTSGAGTFSINLVGAAADGAIYVGNLTIGSSTVPPDLRVYRWANESANPVQVFSGDPTGGAGDRTSANALRFGDTMDVRGAGATTQILFGSRGLGNAVVLTTPDGTTFNANFLQTGVAPGAAGNGPFGLGIAFGAGNSFWGKSSSGQPLRQFTFDLDADTAALAREIPLTSVPSTVFPIGVDAERGVIAGIDIISATDQVRLYKTDNFRRLDSEGMPSDNPNTNGTGAMDFADGRLFVLDSNNGVVAFLAVPEPHEYAMLASLGLLGFAALRRRQAARA
jgi:hypothetical protein